MLNLLLKEKNYQSLEIELNNINDISLLGVAYLGLEYIKKITQTNRNLTEIINDTVSPISKTDKNEFIHDYQYEIYISEYCLSECLNIIENNKTIADSIFEQEKNIKECGLDEVNPNAVSKEALKEEELNRCAYKHFKMKLGEIDKDCCIIVSSVNNKDRIFYFNSCEEINSFLHDFDGLTDDIMFFYKNIKVGILKISFYNMFGKEKPQFHIKLNNDSFRDFFYEEHEAPMGDEWTYEIYKFKELENHYLFIEGECLSSYFFLQNKDFQSMNRNEISSYLMKEYF